MIHFLSLLIFIFFRLVADVHDIRHESAEGDDCVHTTSISAQLRFRSRSYFPLFGVMLAQGRQTCRSVLCGNLFSLSTLQDYRCTIKRHASDKVRHGLCLHSAAAA